MSRQFPLAGLLRLRRIEDEIAASELALANTRARDLRSIQERARRHLEGFGGEAASVTELRAIAAGRLAASARLSELTAFVDVADGEAAHAATAHTDARMRLRGLEKLEARHLSETAAEELREEQLVLDEFATVRARAGSRS